MGCWGMGLTQSDEFMEAYVAFKVDGCECIGPMDISWTKELDR